MKHPQEEAATALVLLTAHSSCLVSTHLRSQDRYHLNQLGGSQQRARCLLHRLEDQTHPQLTPKQQAVAPAHACNPSVGTQGPALCSRMVVCYFPQAGGPSAI